MDAPKGNAGCRNPAFIIPFRASFLFWLETWITEVNNFAIENNQPVFINERIFRTEISMQPGLGDSHEFPEPKR